MAHQSNVGKIENDGRRENMKQQQHRIVEIDPAKFADQIGGTRSTEYIFGTKDVLKFLVDAMNDARISISMIDHAHENAIEYRGRRVCFGTGLVPNDIAEDTVIDGMAELSYILNDYEDTESWTAYRNGKHILHILRGADVQPATMTATEIREAEDNIEASE